MSGHVVREAPHQCNPGIMWANGTIWQCDCGKYWISRMFPNPAFNRWRYIGWLGRKMRGLR